jgi:hypothetical protein
MNMQPRFEAVFYEGEYGERMPEWCVVEWTHFTSSSRSGSTVQSFAACDEQEAKELAWVLQEAYNLEFFANYG